MVNKIIKWIISNKEWLFSGVGVAAAVGLLSLSSSLIFGQKAETESTLVAGGHNEILMNASGSEIKLHELSLNNGILINTGSTEKTQSKKDIDPRVRESLTLELTDGTRVSIDVVIITYVMDAPLLVSRAGSRLAAKEMLLPVVRSKMIQKLELKSLKELKNKRPTIEGELMSYISSSTAIYGVGVRSVTIGSVHKLTDK